MKDLTVLICIHSPDCWVAQGVEYDIAAQAKTLVDVIDAFKDTVAVQIAIDEYHGIKPLSEIPPAPSRFATLVPGSVQLDSAFNRTPGMDFRLCHPRAF